MPDMAGGTGIGADPSMGATPGYNPGYKGSNAGLGDPVNPGAGWCWYTPGPMMGPNGPEGYPR